MNYCYRQQEESQNHYLVYIKTYMVGINVHKILKEKNQNIKSQATGYQMPGTERDFSVMGIFGIIVMKIYISHMSVHICHWILKHTINIGKLRNRQVPNQLILKNFK